MYNGVKRCDKLVGKIVEMVLIMYLIEMIIINVVGKKNFLLLWEIKNN